MGPWSTLVPVQVSCYRGLDHPCQRQCLSHTVSSDTQAATADYSEPPITATSPGPSQPLWPTSLSMKLWASANLPSLVYVAMGLHAINDPK